MVKLEDVLPKDAEKEEFFNSAKEAGVEIEVPEVEDPEASGIGADEDIYVPRLLCPAKDNKYYMTVAYGGLNRCILGNPQYTKGSALDNCVGYAWGRSFELLGSEPKLSRANAEDWWAYKDGYTRSQKPKLGAIACWRKGQAGKGSDGAGHVAVVEKIEGNKITLSNSGYGGPAFYLTTYEVGKMNHGAYTVQGFIWIGDWKDGENTVNIELKVLKRTDPTMHDEQVGTVQILLNKLNNARLAVDKYYGPATEKAVKAWQKKKGLQQDGIIGEATWNSLLK